MYYKLEKNYNNYLNYNYKENYIALHYKDVSCTSASNH